MCVGMFVSIALQRTFEKRTSYIEQVIGGIEDTTDSGRGRKRTIVCRVIGSSEG
jgi:hypothetical protein